MKSTPKKVNSPHIRNLKSPSRDGRQRSPIARRENKSRTCNMGNLKFPLTNVIKSSLKTHQNEDYNEYMEDIGLTFNIFLNEPSKSLFCIFDGHGGDTCVKLVSELFPEQFSSALKTLQTCPEYCLKKTFNKIDQHLKVKACFDNGCTGTVVYIAGRQLFCANIGDSSSYIVTNDTAFMISFDDKCSNESESKRLLLEGGKVISDRLEGKLMLSRAFGDYDLKSKGLISEPHIYKHYIKDTDRYCVLASDGIWDVITAEDLFTLSKGETKPFYLVEKIVQEAIEKGSQDNISCIVVSLK